MTFDQRHAERVSDRMEASHRERRSRVSRIALAVSGRRAMVYCLTLMCITAIPYLIEVVSRVLAGAYPFFANGEPIGADLASHLFGGRLLRDGNWNRLYDLDYQLPVWRQWLPDSAFNPYVSPPFMMFVYAPLAAIPYGAAVIIWSGVTIGLLWWAARLLSSMSPSLQMLGRRRLFWCALSAPPAMFVLFGGQDSAVSLVLLLAGLRLLRADRPLGAGAVLGLGVMKPQLILVIPVILLAQRRWRALIGWVGAAGLLTGISMAMVGTSGIRNFVALPGTDFYRTSVVEGKGWQMQSFVAFARAALPPSLSFLIVPLSVVVGAAALGLLIRYAHRRRGDAEAFPRVFAFAVMTIPFVNPHLFLYDLLILIVPVFLLFEPIARAIRLRWLVIAAFLLLWTTPYRHFAVSGADWPATLVEAPWTLVVILVAFRWLSTATAPVLRVPATPAAPVDQVAGSPAIAAD